MAQAIKGTGPVDVRLNSLLAAITQEYEEMPGLALTAEQARRLWAIEPRTCSVALDRLVAAGYLCQTGNGHYARPKMS